MTDPRGYQSTYTRDYQGQLTSEADPRGNTTNYTWTSGQLTRVASPQGTVEMSYTYFDQVLDVWGSTPTVHNWYNPTTGVLDSTVVAGSDTSRFTYDTRGRTLTARDPEGHLTTIVYADTSAWKNVQAVTAANRTTTYRYDWYGRLKSSTGADGKTTSIEYDAINRDTMVTTPDLGTVRYTWGAVFLDRVTDPRGQVYEWTRNSLGWVETEKQPGDTAGQHLVTQYDRYGRVIGVVNRRGQQVTLGYTTWDRVGTRTANGITTTYSYSADNPSPTAPSWVAASHPASTDTLRFDALGRLDVATTIRGTTSGILVYRMDSNYDALGRRSGLVLTGGATGSITYSYSPTTFRFTGLTGFGGGATTISYNEEGLPVSTALPGGQSVMQTYTSNHLPLETSFSSGAVNLAAGGLYAYDPLNRIARRTQGDGLKKRVYGYDPNGRWLANFRDSAVVGTTRPTCTFDPDLGYVCNDPTVQWTQTYTEAYTYDLNGNPTNQGAAQGAGDRLNQFNGYTLEHDADGNVTRKYKSGFDQYLYWNALGQMDSVKTNGQTTRYQYDGFGRRVRMTTPAGVATLYVYDGDDLLMELDAAGAVVAKYTYYPGVDDPHSVVRGGTTYYYGTDQQGSVLALFSGAGAVVNSYKYYPFGEAESASETVANPLRYTAREYEAATGLYYYRSRWYDPALHRFLSQDPIGLDGGTNLYAYVGNDPVNHTDPFGLYAPPDPRCIREMMDEGHTWPTAYDLCRGVGLSPLVATARRVWRNKAARPAVNGPEIGRHPNWLSPRSMLDPILRFAQRGRQPSEWRQRQNEKELRCLQESLSLSMRWGLFINGKIGPLAVDVDLISAHVGTNGTFEFASVNKVTQGATAFVYNVGREKDYASGDDSWQSTTGLNRAWGFGGGALMGWDASFDLLGFVECAIS